MGRAPGAAQQPQQRSAPDAPGHTSLPPPLQALRDVRACAEGSLPLRQALALAGVRPVLLALPGVAAALQGPAAAPPTTPPPQQQQQALQLAAQALEALVGRAAPQQAEDTPGATRQLQLLQTRPASGAAALLAAAAALPAQAVAFHAAPSTSGDHPRGALRYTAPQAAAPSGAPGTSAAAAAAAAAGNATAAAAVAAAEAALAVLPDDNPGAVAFALLLLHHLLLFPAVGAALQGRRGTLQLLGLCQDQDQGVAALAAALWRSLLGAGGAAAASAPALPQQGPLQRTSLAAGSEPMVGGAAAGCLQPPPPRPAHDLAQLCLRAAWQKLARAADLPPPGPQVGTMIQLDAAGRPLPGPQGAPQGPKLFVPGADRLLVYDLPPGTTAIQYHVPPGARVVRQGSAEAAAAAAATAAAAAAAASASLAPARHVRRAPARPEAGALDCTCSSPSAATAPPVATAQLPPAKAQRQPRAPGCFAM
jgi:hypothetical protein